MKKTWVASQSSPVYSSARRQQQKALLGIIQQAWGLKTCELGRAPVMWQNAGDSDKGIAEVLKFSPATHSARPKMEATRQGNLSRPEKQKLQDKGLVNV